ncbi:hypothetical protein PQX77_004602 [Marasmius sp. AFHP31]|nr:hypothetical protein PQX77_004602 [Marasmius sp. AFHP31]
MDRSAQSGRPGSFTLRAPASVTTISNSELYLKYGSHCNQILFVEYGFVLRRSEVEQAPYEVEVNGIVETMFEAQGDAGSWARSVLEAENYWSDYTLHEFGPSYRLVTALRLYALVHNHGAPIGAGCSGFLAPWKGTISGQSERVSADNEAQWTKLLVDKICEPIIVRADGNLKELDKDEDTEIESVRILWEEERYVALCILERVQNGDELS